MVLREANFYPRIYITGFSPIILKANDICRTVLVWVSEKTPFLPIFSSCFLCLSKSFLKCLKTGS